MNKEKKIKLYKTTSFWLFVSLITVIAVIIMERLLFPGEKFFELKDLINNIISTIVVILIFSFIYEYFVANEKNKILREEILNSIQHDIDTLNLFAIESKLNFIKTIVSSIIGKKYGPLLFDSVISKYLKDEVTYREDFDYEVEIFESRDDIKITDDITLNKDKYYLLSQTITYSKHYPIDFSIPEFKIVFAFDENSLDYWMNDNNVFFREILQIEELENKLQSFNINDFTKFVKEYLCLRLAFLTETGTAFEDSFEYNINNIGYDNSRGLEITLKNRAIINNFIMYDKYSKYYKCNLSFKMPFIKSMKMLHFVLPEPTISPKFSIKFDRRINGIKHLSYLTNSAKNVNIVYDHNLSKYYVNTLEAIYPRSGVIFLWQ